MARDVIEFFQLLFGTVIYRPYVYCFLICFLFFASKHLRVKGTFFYLVVVYLMAFVCEYSSTRNGIPFGVYTYLDETRVRELWISNIPFWDSLSFVFLSYFSWILAASVRSPQAPSAALFQVKTAFLSGLLMMLLDLVIDPLTLLGDRWFLGKIYYYPNGGSYFGVTLSNFVGWFALGSSVPLFFQFLAKIKSIDVQTWKPLTPLFAWGVFAVYSGVFLFNWLITAWIQEWILFAVSGLVILFTLGPIGWQFSRQQVTE